MITLALKTKTAIGGNVWSFVFEPSQRLTWTAGQFVRIEVPHAHPDDEGTKRYFTVASAPHEQHVQIATRITSSTFKQSLAALNPGDTINLLDQPAGDFTWPATGQPLLFAAQGIGITPFYSMLKSRLHHGLPLAAHLFYTSRADDSRRPFQTELEAFARNYPEFTLTLSTERLSGASLAAAHPALEDSLIYVSGPGNLIELLGPPYNVPVTHLRQDFFPNYAATAY